MAAGKPFSYLEIYSSLQCFGRSPAGLRAAENRGKGERIGLSVEAASLLYEIGQTGRVHSEFDVHRVEDL